MRQSLHFAAIALAISAANPQLLDRMVAVVNKHVILESGSTRQCGWST